MLNFQNEYQMLSLKDASARQGYNPIVGQNFTTSDRDNDRWIDGNKKLFAKSFEILSISSLFIFSKGNCSELHTGGWWFGNCGTGNLNGILQNDYNDIYPTTTPQNEKKISFWGEKKIGESIMAVWAPQPYIPANIDYKL